MNYHKAIAFFSGFPDRRFTDEIAERLEKELEVNVGLLVEETDSTDSFTR